MRDERLINMINSGRGVALVGSGPSTEVGYPTWNALASSVFAEVSKLNLVQDADAYQKYLKDSQYPELFRLAERDLGARDTLVSILKKNLLSPGLRAGSIYEYLARWPFSVYLTTNYDDELQKYLLDQGARFAIKQNERSDFYTLRGDTSNLIFKIHGDLDHPDGLILTARDYDRLKTRPEGQYFREKLRSIFEMFDVLIVGHSLYDPHISLILEMAGQASGPAHPVFLIAADVTPGVSQEYLEKYNIVTLTYDNPDGTHKNLRRVLSFIDAFIVPRPKRPDSVVTPPHSDDASAAAAMLIFRRMRSMVQHKDGSPSEYLGPLALYSLVDVGPPGLVLEDILALPALKDVVNSDAMALAMQETLTDLSDRGLVRGASSHFSVTEFGRTQVDEVKAVRETEEGQAIDEFKATILELDPAFPLGDFDLAADTLKTALTNLFKRRGTVIANAVFAGSSARPDEMGDVFRVLTQSAVVFTRDSSAQAFVEAARDFMINPSAPQRRYLEALSQGFFLYHLAGLDPACTRMRRNVFSKTGWFFDSSVLLPLLAKGCHSYEYAVDLFSRLSALDAYRYTTRRLLEETWQHLEWARKNVPDHPQDSLSFLGTATVKGDATQNLFVDGYIRTAAEGRVSSFADYLSLLFPGGVTRVAVRQQLESTGVSVLDVPSLSGFEDSDFAEIDYLKTQIKSQRESRNTYRSELQTQSEAEVLQIVRGFRSGKYSLPGASGDHEEIYFVSLSRLLDFIEPQPSVTSWTPEALYRYLLALPGAIASEDLLQQCMLHQYGAGIAFVDKRRYLRFFGATIDASKADYEEQRELYSRDMEQHYLGELDDAFERTPDLDKPFFVSQLAWKTAEQAQRRADIVSAAFEKAQSDIRAMRLHVDARLHSKSDAKARQEEARLRNSRDPAHIRRRKRQAKKRRRKNK
jgi:SIR2-like domain